MLHYSIRLSVNVFFKSIGFSWEFLVSPSWKMIDIILNFCYTFSQIVWNIAGIVEKTRKYKVVSATSLNPKFIAELKKFSKRNSVILNWNWNSKLPLCCGVDSKKPSKEKRKLRMYTFNRLALHFESGYFNFLETSWVIMSCATLFLLALTRILSFFLLPLLLPADFAFFAALFQHCFTAARY